MKSNRYTYIIYSIATVIFITLAIQIYWNYKNYESGKEQLKREVQISLNQAVDAYYEEVAIRNTLGLYSSDDTPDTDGIRTGISSWIKSLDTINKRVTGITINDTSNTNGFLSIQGASPHQIDSIINKSKLKVEERFSKTLEKVSPNSSRRTSWKITGDNQEVVDSLYNRIEQNVLRNNKKKGEGDQKALDSIIRDTTRLSALTDLTTKIIVSFKDDQIDVKRLDTIVVNQLKAIGIDRKAHSLTYSPKGDTITKVIPGSPKYVDPTYQLNVIATSKLLPSESILSVGFNDVTSIILKRNLLGILLSFVLMVAVISSLLYLLKIIREQKQLAEIKNDFISNITHEFKTPITTISAAIEGIQHFNKENDKEKTEKYLAMSTTQLGKLNTMVERILDTATLDKEDLSLKKERCNLVEVLEHLIKKYKEIAPEIPITLKSSTSSIWATVDVFHLENAIDNLVDNATKYGKPPVTIAISNTNSNIHLSITDTGKALTKDQASQLFEKFYRVPKGNTHDVKGFGIGLYYTKTIIEKHNGSIEVSTVPQTSFKITIPNGND
ncbi:two-component system phosphate regulon sensor histidine kinase PhoR [Dokdonia sp. Hel_I_63]|uniref:sensor histidine kinase n=1 Tax=Dokdonia sp. Hel_I_63 TaxID=1249996 RepID=UPI00119AA317|nr:HAMP domain-containing sensor histidine kinase [Dokdonia sp. Hel_I_63]TVZ22027.1 two-component system phosphate regulon sensor histidine kinase PhoR [Dokdonia sp. Hel_I_63]